MHGEEKREEYAIVLDFLSTGKSFSGRSEPIAQLIGEEWFTLLEAVPKPDVKLTPGERVYIGKAERDKISLIKTRITYNELTEHGKSELPVTIMRIVKEHEQRFVDVFNNAGPLNIREHSLELLPGIGKKHMDAILKARTEKKFESFKDITDRVSLMQDPAKLITDRIVEELLGTGRFYMFTKPYVKREDDRGGYRGRR
jgi:putative nucleotide binding protein